MQAGWRSAFIVLFTWTSIVSGAFFVPTPANAAASGADDYLACPMSNRERDEANARDWWNRRSALEQRTILALPCEERFVPIVCIFLYEPDLVKCTDHGLAEYKANKACETKGLDLLSQAMADCKAEYKKTYKSPLTGGTS